jgi:tRNA G18 (ribose-2'-O)-methylase SpoU
MSKQIIGVGPHPTPLPSDDRFDRQLLENGDHRNVIDKYRYWTNQAIKDDLSASRVSLHVAIENWQHDFNIGTIIRNANAFNVETVHTIGKKHYNRRGAMVTDKYLNIVHHDSVDSFSNLMASEDRPIIAIDILPGSKQLSKIKLPKKAVLVFGGEGPGLSDEILNVADKQVMIEQFGSTRSINVGVASGIAMYVWMQQNILK